MVILLFALATGLGKAHIGISHFSSHGSCLAVGFRCGSQSRPYWTRDVELVEVFVCSTYISLAECSPALSL